MFFISRLLFCFSHRMFLSCLRICSQPTSHSLHVCAYATVSKAFRPREKNNSGPVFQYVGQNRKPNHKVFVWGFSFTGALGIPSFVVPDSGKKHPRKQQLSPYRLETAEQVFKLHNEDRFGRKQFHTVQDWKRQFPQPNSSSSFSVADLFCCLWLWLHTHRLLNKRCDQTVGHGPEQRLPIGLSTDAAKST